MSQFALQIAPVRTRWRPLLLLLLTLESVPRKLRSDLADGLFHVTARGNRRQEIFLGDRDRGFFLALLSRVATELSWQVHGYCLLETHYHLLIDGPVAVLSKGMQRLNGAYAQCFNSAHGVEGHVFQGRFYAGPVEADGHLLELTRYLALNPVRAGLCSGPAGWAWSSYPAMIGLRQAEPFLVVERVLEMFSTRPDRARVILRRFVIEDS